MRNSGFVDFVLDQLGDLREVEARRMFGGHGLYAGEVFFAIVWRDRLFFRTDAESRDEYVRLGAGPFRPNARQTLKSYYEVPADVLEDRARLTAWAERALMTHHGGVTAAKKRRKGRRATRSVCRRRYRRRLRGRRSSAGAACARRAFRPGAGFRACAGRS